MAVKEKEERKEESFDDRSKLNADRCNNFFFFLI